MNSRSGFTPHDDVQLMTQKGKTQHRGSMKSADVSRCQDPKVHFEGTRPSQIEAKRGSSGSSVPVQTEFVYSTPESHNAVHLHGDWNSWEPIAMHIESGMFSVHGHRANSVENLKGPCGNSSNFHANGF